jgi:molybdopterin converting factor small subunit
MKVTINAFANLRIYVSGGACEMALSAGASVKDLLAALNVPSQVDAVVLVNGRRADLDAVLNAGDAVTLFPPMEGG